MIDNEDEIIDVKEQYLLSDEVKKLLDNFPFLSYGKMIGKEYIGIMQNCDSQMISMYILTDIPNKIIRDEFIKYGDLWWWESNRKTPINIFLKEKFLPFRPYLKHFSRKDFELIAGHIVSLQENMSRRIRKRQITLIRKIP